MAGHVFIAALLLTAASSPAFAGAAEDAAFAPFHRFVDAMNKGDMKAAAAAYAPSASIIDEFAPHSWQGGNAFAQWDAAFDADSKAHGIAAWAWAAK